MDVEIQTHELGAVLSIKVAPGSRRNEIRGCQDGALKISVTQIAEKGKANRAVIAFLSKRWRVSKSQMEIISGQTAREKKLLIRNVSKHDVQQLLG